MQPLQINTFSLVKDQDDYDEVLFLLKTGPYAFGKTYNFINANRKIIDSIYKKEPLVTRQAINNRIIANSRAEAIRTKNATLANYTASFIRSSWGKDYLEGNRRSTIEMLNYYKTVKDTTRFYQQALYFYDGYLNISADSAKKLEKIALDKMKENVKNNIKSNEVKKPVDSTKQNKVAQKQVVVLRQFETVSSSNSVATTLNNAAWDFYTMGTHNTNYLIKAYIWSRRSIELQPIYGFYDTMAHIMYRLGFYAEAEINQQKAVEMATNQQPSVSAKEIELLKAELGKIKEHTL